MTGQNFSEPFVKQAFMLHTSPPGRALLRITALLLLSGLLFGCASTREAERRITELSSQNSALQQKNQQLSRELAKQKTMAARLQMQLIETQVDFDRKKTEQEITPKEPESVRSRILPASSKAEAVTCLAEAETEINASIGPDNTDEEKEAFNRAKSLLEQSRSALARNSYDETCALAYQGLAAIREVRLKTALSTRVSANTYADFIEPLQLQALKRSNIRKRPGTQSKILKTIAAGSTVTAVGFQGNWIKVRTGYKQTGWIYYTLLTAPAPGKHGRLP